MTDELARYEGHIPANDNPRWGQSYYYNFYDPKCRVGALLRVGLLENQREANTWFIVFKDGQPLFNRTNMNLPYTDERPDTGLSLAGMRVEATVPLKQTRITLDVQDFSFSCTWDELHPMEDCIAMSNDTEGAMAREMAHVHLEGTSRVTGHIVSRGQRIDINGTGFRDIAAGPRNWDGIKGYRLAWPVFENGTAVAGVHGTSIDGRSTYMRMVHDGQRWCRIKDMKTRHAWTEDGFAVARAHWEVTDEHDRRIEFTAKPLFRWMFPLDTFIMCEQIMEYRLADGTVGYGLYETGFRLPWDGIEGGLA